MLYIHIPYCLKKCIYCDFFSGGAIAADWNRLKNALLEELESRVEELPPMIDSIYLGGGTPSMMPAEEFEELSAGIRKILTFSGRTISENAEITIEANPEDVNPDIIGIWKRGGVNRVSLGIQTFSDHLLKRIGRTHSGLQAEEALVLLTEYFNNVSGDIIFGLPGETLEDLKRDIKRIIRIGPQHISVYSLMYEEGTALTTLRDIGRIRESDEEDVNNQYAELSKMLRHAGYKHYEISNYALAGYRARHNSGYWSGKPYLGIGPSAHSFDGKDTRRANKADLKGYLKRFSSGRGPDFFTEEKLDQEKLFTERLMLSLRTSDGLNMAKLEKDFGSPAAHRVMKRADRYLRNGQLKFSDNRLSLTDTGIMVADPIILELLQ